MSNLLLFWIGVWIAFLILELITATFYGFSLAISSFIVAVYILVQNPTEVDIIQAVIFVLSAMVFSFLFPKILMPKNSEDRPQGLDMYIGESRRVRLVGEDFKISLDGVEYILVSDDDLEDKDIVKIVDRRWSVFIGERA